MCFGIRQEARDAGEDQVRILLKGLLQRLLEEEMTVCLRAEPYERAKGRREGEDEDGRREAARGGVEQ